MSKRNIILVVSVLTIFAVIVYANFFQRRVSQIPQMQSPEIQKTSEEIPQDVPRLSIVAKNLEIPWALAFLPDKSILFTERPGRVRLIDKEGKLLPTPIAEYSDVKSIGEGGLLGITIHPNFEVNHYVYLYYTYGQDNNLTLNRIERFEFDAQFLRDGTSALRQSTIIVDRIPGAPNHNGGRIKFGPDKFLYITTGDAQNPSLAQDKNSLAGKILRVTDEGRPAPGNPFNNLVYSYGHRNSQGLAWDKDGRLWETEHGQSATDEINLIAIGKNYGWPEIREDQEREGMENPILHSRSDTWAPSGAAYLNGSIFFAGLRGQTFYKALISGKGVTLTEHLKGELGRIREVVVGPDNMLYITTSNRDGRGVPDSEDDKIIRVNPKKL